MLNVDKCIKSQLEYFVIFPYDDIYKHFFLNFARLRGKISCVWYLRLWNQESNFLCLCDNSASDRIKGAIWL